MKKSIIILLTLTFVFTTVIAAFCEELVVYTARKEHLIRPLFESYTRQTGVNIKYITGKAPVLLQRLKAEGRNTPADLLITVDAGNLWHAASEGVLQPVDSKVLSRNIPGHLKDPGNRWFGLSVRARTIVYHTARVKPAELSTYENLANPQWKGRLILRTSKKVYNQSLVAMLITEHGIDDTEQIVKGWVDNLGTPPFSNDTRVMQAIAAGQGDVGIVNTYYYGRLMRKDPNLPLAIFWPNQQTGGVHVNVSGAGITTHARQKQAAVDLLEWLSSPGAQNLFADGNLEYPANSAVEPNAVVAGWGTFKQNPINLENAGAFQAEAIRLMDRAGYK
ncbi:ABC transporter substrate-binding protein [Alkalispirochaeta odontotermitis]|nr:ABC transporter substrate-binding protein [Alkalispirochaeta odontotermitis]CAB1085551.1 Ferric iron ABC transporter, iron-binding protein [Olavius algarvensis Delta 1 endosymbiont]